MGHNNAALALKYVREMGLAAILDEDGDIRIDAGGSVVYVSLNSAYIKCFMLFETAAPANALATVSRRLQRDMLVGRLTYPDRGGSFEISYVHAYDTVVREFDVRNSLMALDAIREAVSKIADEMGYVL